ncbi:MAG: alpha/beta hydrolase, partial [Acidobacteriota bacterium]
IGHSWGGFLSALYAAEFPEKVSALVLISPADVLVMPQERDLFQLIRNRLPAEMQNGFDAFMEEYFNFADIFSKSEEDLKAINREFGKYYRIASTMDLPEQREAGGWMVHAMYFSMGQRHDYRAALGKVDAPVLVIHGANDLQSEEATRSYVSAFPNAQLQVIKDAGHFSFIEQPSRFSQVVSEFLERVGQ